jgi:hypothetical protein
MIKMNAQGVRTENSLISKPSLSNVIAVLLTADVVMSLTVLPVAQGMLDYILLNLKGSHTYVINAPKTVSLVPIQPHNAKLVMITIS